MKQTVINWLAAAKQAETEQYHEIHIEKQNNYFFLKTYALPMSILFVIFCCKARSSSYNTMWLITSPSVLPNFA